MSHTYCTNLVHCVFSTKMQTNLINDRLRERLYAYILGIANNLKIEIIALGGTENHIHMLIALKAKQSLSDTIRDLKANSSRWMSENSGNFSWQEGFGAFSVSPSQAKVVKEYSESRGTSPQEKFRGRVRFIAQEIWG
jgi:REP element-mobilizing transposase RayT